MMKLKRTSKLEPNKNLYPDIQNKDTNNTSTSFYNSAIKLNKTHHEIIWNVLIFQHIIIIFQEQALHKIQAWPYF